MSVVAAVAEGALALALVKVLAVDQVEILLVLRNQLVLVYARANQVIRWNDQVAILPADRTRPEMQLRHALVVG